MNAATDSKIAYLGHGAPAAAPELVMPAARLEAARARAEAARQAAFSDAMELALNGVVLVGCLLFGAGLLRLGVPACAARDWGLAVMYTLAGFGGFYATVTAVLGVLLLIPAKAAPRV